MNMKKLIYLFIFPLLLMTYTPVYGEPVTSPIDPASLTEENFNSLFENPSCSSPEDCHTISYQPICPTGQVLCSGVCKKTCEPPPPTCKSPQKKCWDGKCYKTCPCKTGTKKCDDGTCKKTCEPSYLASCDIKPSIMGKNLRGLFCKVGDRYNISASVLAALYARESKVWEGHTHVNRATFGADIKSENDFASRCVRNSATATGPVQLIDTSWVGHPNWSVGEISGSNRANDKCNSGACAGAKRAFDISNSMSRCRWLDAISSQASLIMIMYSYGDWYGMKSACGVTGIKNGKLVNPKWTDACVRAYAHGYFGGSGYEDRVLDPFHDIKK
ncbi:MAG: hypothetical protein WCI63_02530 [bacterium]